MKRRDFLLSGGPMVALAATATPALALGTETVDQQIAHHADELMRLLKESAPEGFERIPAVTLVPKNGNIITGAFPGGAWNEGDRMATYTRKTGWFKA
ncbi:hypothetical protein [Salipiger thiooxidans]|uniref:hypothetical protein n=1 Tax=Salipiger thiooxidans TaxID=282683 RepID=UPI001CD37CDF|nr:hypothetical protein [Salipiger thiooxidans]MCA0847184.1 hypothetical protein [Salipiger thiooxidans]